MLSRLITRKEQLVLLALAGAISMGSLVLFFHRSAPPPTKSPTVPHKNAITPASSHAVTRTMRKDPPAQPATAPALPTPITVSIIGAVRRPGVYQLNADARVQDGIDKAGGTSEQANMTDLNLAAKLMDGSTLSVPVAPVWDQKSHAFVYPSAEAAASNNNPPQYTRSGWRADSAASAISTVPSSPTAGKPGAMTAINLNTATQEELESLPGIGPKLARQIILYRAKYPFQSIEDLDNVPGFGPRRIAQIRPLVTVR